MKRNIFTIGLFVSFFLSVFILMSYFSVFNTFLGFGITKMRALMSSFIFVFLYLLVTVLTNFFGESLLSVKRVFNSFIGGIWIFFVVNIFTYLLNLFLKINIFYVSIITLIVGITLILYSLFNAYNIKIKNIDIVSEKLDKDYSFVHLSDVHIGSLHQKELNRIVDITNKQNPDFVLITGDLFDEKLNDNALSVLDEIEVPVYFSYGNHELYVKGHEKIMQGSSNTIVLRNQIVELSKSINVVGIDDGLKLSKELSQIEIDEKKYNILMYHRPSEVHVAKKNKLDLMLCGHTHNGQIWPFKYLVKLEFKYSYGLFNFDNFNLYVTSGVGFWGPQMRLGTSSEIPVFNLKKR